MPPKKKSKKKGKKRTQNELPPHIKKDYGALVGGALFALYTLLQWIRCCPKRDGPDKGTGFAPLAHWRMFAWFFCCIMTGMMSMISRGIIGNRDWHPLEYMFRSLASGVGLLLLCTQFMMLWHHSILLVKSYTTLVWVPLAAAFSWVDRYAKSSLYIGDAFGGLALGYMMIYGAMAKRCRDLLYACVLIPFSQYIIGKDGYPFINFFYYLGMIYGQKFMTNAIMTAQGRKPPKFPL